MLVLIVDDNKLLQRRLGYAIKNIDVGINIQNAYSCQEATALFTSSNPDIVVLDISLPDGSGIDLLPEIKERNPSVQVFVFTSFTATEFKSTSMKLGANQFFEKSEINKLIQLIAMRYRKLAGVPNGVIQ